MKITLCFRSRNLMKITLCFRSRNLMKIPSCLRSRNLKILLIHFLTRELMLRSYKYWSFYPALFCIKAFAFMNINVWKTLYQINTFHFSRMLLKCLHCFKCIFIFSCMVWIIFFTCIKQENDSNLSWALSHHFFHLAPQLLPRLRFLSGVHHCLPNRLWAAGTSVPVCQVSSL